jgi:hypothetical protein
MRTRVIKKSTKVLTANATNVVTFKRASDFTEGRIKTYLSELGMDVREHNKMTAIRLEMRLIDKGLITI